MAKPLHITARTKRTQIHNAFAAIILFCFLHSIRHIPLSFNFVYYWRRRTCRPRLARRHRRQSTSHRRYFYTQAFTSRCTISILLYS